MNDASRLTIRMKKNSRTAWNTLLQRGFHLQGPAGKTVREFLISVFEYNDCFIDETVRTVFLNSSPVDDINTAHVKEGDRLALGSAMPGLVGICMGRDNPYKDFRSGIACQADEVDDSSGESIRVFAKIFSSLAVETGEDILRRGIEVDASHLADLLEEHSAHLVDGPSPADFPAGKTLFISVEFV